MNDHPNKKLGYTLPEAAEAASVGLSTLKAAIDRGDLPRRYPSTRPIILATDLELWLESLPTEVAPAGSARRAGRTGGLTLQQLVAQAEALGVDPETLLLRHRGGQ